jgi:hypothetical protein
MLAVEVEVELQLLAEQVERVAVETVLVVVALAQV